MKTLKFQRTLKFNPPAPIPVILKMDDSHEKIRLLREFLLCITSEAIADEVCEKFKECINQEGHR